MTWIKSPLVRDLITGAVAIAGIAGLVLMLLAVGELQGLTRESITVTVRVDAAAGLSDASAVTLNGVRVGRVRSVRPAIGEDGVFRGVELRLALDRAVPIPRPASVFIDRSLVGEGTLQLELPVGARAGDAPLADGDMLPPDPLAPPLVAQSSFERLAGSVAAPLADFRATAGKIDRLADTYTTVGEQLIELLKAGGDGSEPGVRSVIARADAVLAGAEKWLAQDELLADARRSLDRLNATLEQAGQAAQSVDRAAQTVAEQGKGVGAEVTLLRERVAQTLGTVDRAVEEFAAVGAAINSGRGTAGQLVNNPDLYRSAEDAVKRLDAALADLQLLIEKFKAEGVRLRL